MRKQGAIAAPKRTFAAVLLVAALCSMASVCGDDDPDSGQVLYEFHGSCAGDLTYVVGETTEQVDNAPSGWTKRFTGHDGDFVYLSAQNTCASGTVSVRIAYRDREVNAASSTGAYVIATASGSL